MKITSSKLHQNDLAICFYKHSIDELKYFIRTQIDYYKRARSVRSSIFGSIHALYQLSLELEDNSTYLMSAEIIEWQEILLKYLKRIEKKIPENIREDFIKQVENEFQLLLQKSSTLPEWLWKQGIDNRRFTIELDNQATIDKYYNIAKQDKRFNQLGNPLANYLIDCLKQLDDVPEIKVEPIKYKTDALAPKMYEHDGEFTYLLTEFECFLTNQQFENDIEINAYQVEKAVKKTYLY